MEYTEAGINSKAKNAKHDVTKSHIVGILKIKGFIFGILPYSIAF